MVLCAVVLRDGVRRGDIQTMSVQKPVFAAGEAGDVLPAAVHIQDSCLKSHSFSKSHEGNAVLFPQLSTAACPEILPCLRSLARKPDLP